MHVISLFEEKYGYVVILFAGHQFRFATWRYQSRHGKGARDNESFDDPESRAERLRDLSVRAKQRES